VGWPPLGNKCRQPFAAAWKVDEPVSSPLATIPPWALGSGKFGTPCERIHFANARASAPLPPGMAKLDCDEPPCPGPPPGPEAPLGPELLLAAGGVLPCELAALVVVVLPRLATPALSGLLPQAATSRAPIAIATPNAVARRRPSGTAGTGGLDGLFTSLVITKARLQERNSRAAALPGPSQAIAGAPRSQARPGLRRPLALPGPSRSPA
jgi:hypothetical protein